MSAEHSQTAALLTDLRDSRFDGPLNHRAAAEIERLRSVIREARDNLRDQDDASAYLVLKHSGVSDAK
jgi:hypothetical protein